MTISTFSNIIINNIPSEQIVTFTGGDIVAIIIGISSLIITLCINNKNINAELKSKSSIAWIQDIKKISSELLSTYYQILLNYDFDVKDIDKLLKAKELTEMLMLNFSIDTDVKQVDLYDKVTNEGKNNQIAEYINDIYESFLKYYGNEKILDDKMRAPDQKQKHMVGKKENRKDIDEIKYIITEEIKEDLYKKLEKLRDVLRIYLKIEWDEAKFNKKKKTKKPRNNDKE